MKKSLIALAVVSTFAAQAAMAEVTIYGAANVSFDMTNNGTTTAGVAGTSANKVTSNVSKLGFKGSEDLGDGLSAIWQIEQQINIDNGSNSAGTATASTFATRDTFAGLSSTSMGTVIAGIHDTPYKMATRGLDLFADTIADNRSLMGQSGGGVASHDARLGNVIAYISPAFSGVTLAGAYVAAAENATLSAQTKASAYSLAALYGAGPISASFAYQVINGGTANGLATGGASATVGALSTSDKASAWKVGGGYDFGQGVVNAAYEKTSSSLTTLAALGGGDALAQTNYYVAGKFNVGANDAVKLAYTHAGTNPQAAGTATVANSDAHQFSVGYDHNLSKRTTVYALYTKLSNGSAATYAMGGVVTGAVANLGAGASPSAFSLGMKHAF